MAPDEAKKPEEEPKAEVSSPAEKKSLVAKKIPSVAPKPLSVATAPVKEPDPVIEVSDLHVNSNPPGAKVSIGGATESKWVTPFTADKMPAGEYAVVFTKPGFKAVTKNVNMAGGKAATVSAELISLQAHVNVNSVPEGAEIFLDGKTTSQLTPANLAMDKGEHQIEVRKNGYQEAAVETNLSEGENYNFAPILQVDKPEGRRGFGALRGMFGGGDKIPAGKGMLNLKTTPPGALVFHNGKASGKLTPIKWPIEPGSYKVTIKLDGYEPSHQEFTITEGKVTNMNVTLEPK